MRTSRLLELVADADPQALQVVHEMAAAGYSDYKPPYDWMHGWIPISAAAWASLDADQKATLKKKTGKDGPVTKEEAKKLESEGFTLKKSKKKAPVKKTPTKAKTETGATKSEEALAVLKEHNAKKTGVSTKSKYKMVFTDPDAPQYIAKSTNAKFDKYGITSPDGEKLGYIVQNEDGWRVLGSNEPAVSTKDEAFKQFVDNAEKHKKPEQKPKKKAPVKKAPAKKVEDDINSEAIVPDGFIVEPLVSTETLKTLTVTAPSGEKFEMLHNLKSKKTVILDSEGDIAATSKDSPKKALQKLKNKVKDNESLIIDDEPAPGKASKPKFDGVVYEPHKADQFSLEFEGDTYFIHRAMSSGKTFLFDANMVELGADLGHMDDVIEKLEKGSFKKKADVDAKHKKDMILQAYKHSKQAGDKQQATATKMHAVNTGIAKIKDFDVIDVEVDKPTLSYKGISYIGNETYTVDFKGKEFYLTVKSSGKATIYSPMDSKEVAFGMTKEQALEKLQAGDTSPAESTVGKNVFGSGLEAKLDKSVAASNIYKVDLAPDQTVKVIESSTGNVTAAGKGVNSLYASSMPEMLEKLADIKKNQEDPLSKLIGEKTGTPQAPSQPGTTPTGSKQSSGDAKPPIVNYKGVTAIQKTKNWYQVSIPSDPHKDDIYEVADGDWTALVGGKVQHHSSLQETVEAIYDALPDNLKQNAAENETKFENAGAPTDYAGPLTASEKHNIFFTDPYAMDDEYNMQLVEDAHTAKMGNDQDKVDLIHARASAIAQIKIRANSATFAMDTLISKFDSEPAGPARDLKLRMAQEVKSLEDSRNKVMHEIIDEIGVDVPDVMQEIDDVFNDPSRLDEVLRYSRDLDTSSIKALMGGGRFGRDNEAHRLAQLINTAGASPRKAQSGAINNVLTMKKGTNDPDVPKFASLLLRRADMPEYSHSTNVPKTGRIDTASYSPKAVLPDPSPANVQLNHAKSNEVLAGGAVSPDLADTTEAKKTVMRRLSERLKDQFTPAEVIRATGNQTMAMYVDADVYDVRVQDVADGKEYDASIGIAADMFPGMDTVPANSERGKEIMLRQAIGQMVNMWAQSSNDDHPVSLALQESAAKEFDLQEVAPWRIEPDIKAEMEARLNESEAFYRAFLRAQYDITQADLKNSGLTHVELIRGFQFNDESSKPQWAKDAEQNVGGKIDTPVFRPMSSWSTDEHVAEGFADYGGLLLKSAIPAELILSMPQSGFGCLNEYEFVVLGTKGEYTAEMSQH